MKRSLFKSSKGVAAIEAAILLPIFVALIVAAIEFYQFFRAQSLLDRVAYDIAYSLSMQRQVHNDGQCTVATNICVYEHIANDLYRPLDFSRHGRIIIAAYTGVQTEGSTATRWQPGNGWPVSFGNGSLSSSGTLLNALPTPRAGETVIVVQTLYQTSPLILTERMWRALRGSPVMQGQAALRPRHDELRTLGPRAP